MNSWHSGTYFKTTAVCSVQCSVSSIKICLAHTVGTYSELVPGWQVLQFGGFPYKRNKKLVIKVNT